MCLICCGYFLGGNLVVFEKISWIDLLVKVNFLCFFKEGYKNLLIVDWY